MEFHIKKSPFKESKCGDGGHSLNRDFTVSTIKVVNTVVTQFQNC